MAYVDGLVIVSPRGVSTSAAIFRAHIGRPAQRLMSDYPTELRARLAEEMTELALRPIVPTHRTP